MTRNSIRNNTEEENQAVETQAEGNQVENTQANTQEEENQTDKSHICPICRQIVYDTQEGAQCDICDNWYHNPCQDITDELYAVLCNEKYTISWYCKICEKGAKKIMNKVMKLSKRVDETEGRLDKIDTDILGMKQEMTKKEDLNNLKLDTMKYVDKKIAEQIDE